MGFISDRQEKRMGATGGTQLSVRTYNLVIGLITLYGILANVLICYIIKDKLNDMNPILFIVGYFVLGISGILISSFSKNAGISFLGYNLVVLPVGAVVSMVVSTYVKSDSIGQVYQAIVYTAIITFVMIVLSIIFPNFFSKIGGFLFMCLIGLIIAEITALFLFPGTQNIFSWLGAILFALYIGHDHWKAQQFPKTLDNAVDSALDLYLDIINLFLRLLSSRSSSSRSKK